VSLTIYGDFNCPFSALASARVDVLLAAGSHQIDWRAIQHDTTIPVSGEPVVGPTAAALREELATILELTEPDLGLRLEVPTVRSNTALASAALAAAGDDTDGLRRRLFAAVWAEDRDVGDPAELHRLDADGRDPALARKWQEGFEALPRPVTPILVLPDAYVSRGLGALARLGELVRTTDHAGG
jgi:2-hydroxychromene-2-carboxylate isomerase